MITLNFILLRSKTGKLMVIKKMKGYIESTVANHIGQTKSHFESSKLRKEDFKNAYETY